MSTKPTGLSEIRLIIHGYPNHTTVALVTRERNGSENWDRRQHAWDLPLPQRDYEFYKTEDQLWMVLAALATKTMPRREVTWAEPPASPVGDHRGQQDTLPWAEPAT